MQRKVPVLLFQGVRVLTGKVGKLEEPAEQALSLAALLQADQGLQVQPKGRSHIPAIHEDPQQTLDVGASLLQTEELEDTLLRPLSELQL